MPGWLYRRSLKEKEGNKSKIWVNWRKFTQNEKNWNDHRWKDKVWALWGKNEKRKIIRRGLKEARNAQR